MCAVCWISITLQVNGMDALFIAASSEAASADAAGKRSAAKAAIIVRMLFARMTPSA